MAENNKASNQAESEELFRALMNTMMDSVIIIDWTGNLQFANSAAVKLVELDKMPETLSSVNIRTFVHPDSMLQAFKDLALVRIGRGGFLSEYKIKTADEDDFIFLDSIYRSRYPAEEGLLPLGEPGVLEAKRAIKITKGIVKKLVK